MPRYRVELRLVRYVTIELTADTMEIAKRASMFYHPTPVPEGGVRVSADIRLVQDGVYMPEIVDAMPLAATSKKD